MSDLTPQTVLQGLHRQLDRETLPYLTIARQQGHGLQVVLFVMPDGRLGSPKVSIDTRGDTRGDTRRG